MSILRTPSAPATPRPGRTLRLHSAGGRLALTIVEAKGRKLTETNYHVERIASDLGPAFALRKFSCEPLAEGQDRENHVLLSSHGNTCDCRGHLRHADKGVVCRHVAAVLKLREMGRLPA